MRLESVRIENLRAFEDRTITFDPYTCIVGPNGSGKSTVLCALNIFFRETKDTDSDLLNLQEEDFYKKETDREIRITVTFIELNSEVQKQLKDYYRQGKLIVTAIAKWDQETQRAVVKQFGNRKVMKEFSPYFQKVSEKGSAADLRDIYKNIRITYKELPSVSTMPDMKDALRSYESKHEELCYLQPSTDEFYGWQGTNKLKPFLQWIFVPAVKDASSEQSEGRNTYLGRV